FAGFFDAAAAGGVCVPHRTHCRARRLQARSRSVGRTTGGRDCAGWLLVVNARVRGGLDDEASQTNSASRKTHLCSEKTKATAWRAASGSARPRRRRRAERRGMGLFGSFLREQQGHDSDVDMLVEFEPGRKTFDAFMQLACFLESLFGRRVELVTPESFSPYIG